MLSIYNINIKRLIFCNISYLKVKQIIDTYMEQGRLTFRALRLSEIECMFTRQIDT